jgi:O-antigen/teichoic acid export membrane protein
LVRVGFLMAIVMLAVIPEVTLVLFGQAWLPIVSIFRLMTIYVVLDPLYVNLSYLVIGLGRPDILSRTRLLQVALFVVSVPLFAYQWGVQGIAVAANLMILSGTLILLAFSRRVLEFSLFRLLGWPIVALVVASAAGVALVYRLAGKGLWMAMILKAVCVSAVYVLVLGCAERHILREYGEWIWRVLSLRLRQGVNNEPAGKDEGP